MSALLHSLSSLTPLDQLQQRRHKICSEIDAVTVEIQRNSQTTHQSASAVPAAVLLPATSASVALAEGKLIVLQHRLLLLEQFIYERELHVLRSQQQATLSVSLAAAPSRLAPAESSRALLPPMATRSPTSAQHPVTPQLPSSSSSASSSVAVRPNGGTSSSASVAAPTPRYRGGKRVACQGCFHVRVACEAER